MFVDDVAKVAVAAVPPMLKDAAVPEIFVPVIVGVVVNKGLEPPTKTPVPPTKAVVFAAVW